ncbi:MAG TPA: hypothetical protein VI078_02800 [bacterium]
MTLFEKFQTLMTAAAFAEENEHGAARQIALEALAKQPAGRETRTTITGTLAVEPGK